MSLAFSNLNYKNTTRIIMIITWYKGRSIKVVMWAGQENK